jgi:predicted ferric reductase
LLAIPFLRKFLYELFLKSHYALAFVASYALWQHARGGKIFNQDRIFLLTSMGLFVGLNLTRIIGILYLNTSRRLSWTTARVVQFNGAAEVIITVPRPCKIEPGQYFNLWTPAAGFLSFSQIHPFSVAWWSEDEKGRAATVSLLVKAQHGLSRHIVATNARESFIVVLDGPYGQAVDPSGYGTLVLFARGIGIAAQLSVLKRAYMDYQLGNNTLRRISVIWQMDSERGLTAPEPGLSQLIRDR